MRISNDGLRGSAPGSINHKEGEKESVRGRRRGGKGKWKEEGLIIAEYRIPMEKRLSGIIHSSKIRVGRTKGQDGIERAREGKTRRV